MANEAALTPMERRIVRGMVPSKSDRLMHSKGIMDNLSSILNGVIDVGDGTQITVMESLIVRKISFDMEHPDKIDLEKYDRILKTAEAEKPKDTKSIFDGMVIDADKPNETK